MKDIHSYGIGRLGGYASAVALVAIVLSSCASQKTQKAQMRPENHSARFQEVHSEFHKKMLAERKYQHLIKIAYEGSDD